MNREYLTKKRKSSESRLFDLVEDIEYLRIFDKIKIIEFNDKTLFNQKYRFNRHHLLYQI